MTNPLGARKQDKLMAMCTFPSINYTPWRKKSPPLPYPVWKMLDNSKNTVPRTNFNGEEVYILNQSIQPDCFGDFPGRGGGIKSGTVSDEVEPIDGSASAIVGGQRLIRKGDPCYMNKRNTRGKYTDLGSVMSGLSDLAHTVLGVISFIPVVGTIAAFADALLYAAEGDWVNAGVSLVSMIPGCKLGTAAVKGLSKLAQGVKVALGSSRAGRLFTAGGAWIKGTARNLKVSKCVFGTGIQIGTEVLGFLFGSPVNALQGAKVLANDEDLDFSSKGYLPFYLQRLYNSQNPNVGWFGQGWKAQGLEQHLELDPQHDRINLIDNSGRRVPFPHLKPGKHAYQPYEDLTLYRLPLAKDKQHTTLDGQPLLADAESGARLGMQEPLEFIVYEGKIDPKNLPQTTNQIIKHSGIAQYFCHVSSRTIKASSVVGAMVKPSKQTDQYGHELQLHYTYHKDSGSAHLPSHITDSNNDCYQLEFTHIFSEDSNTSHPRLHKLWKLTDTNNKQLLVEYQYNQTGDLIQVINQGHSLRKFGYTDHLITEQTLPSGLKAYYRYDQTNQPKTARVIKHWIDNGTDSTETYHFSYTTDENGHGTTTVTEQKGSELERTHSYQYDDWYNLTAYTNPQGSTTKISIDHLHRVTDIHTKDGGHIKHQYHGQNLGMVAQKTNTNPITGLAEYRTSRYQYDLNNNLIALIDPLGNKQTLTYNPQGEIISHTNELGHKTHYAYDNHGNLTSQTLANGSQYSFKYDQTGNLIAQTDCSGHSTHYQYDDKFRLIVIADAKGQQTQYHYDPQKPWLDLIKQVIYADGTQSKLIHDNTGRLLKHTDAKGNQTQYEYSIDDLPTKRIDALGHTLRYEYDSLRRLSKLINENDEEWTFSYDKADNLISETRFDGFTSHYEYDKAGQLVHQTDNPSLKREEQRHVYLQRDLLGQLTHKHSLDFYEGKQRHHKTKYQYDLAGQLIKATSPDAGTELSYDKAGQLIQETLIRHHSKQTTIKQTLTHEYDEIGNRVKTTLPDGKILNQLYYGSGHLYNQSLTDTTGAITEIRHSNRNELHQEVSRLQGQLSTQFDYDPMGRLSRQHNQAIDKHYAYDTLGQLTHLSGKTQINPKENKLYQRNHQYQYDNLGRLTQHILN